MKEIILLILLVIVVIPVAVLAGIIKLIIWLVRKYQSRKNPVEQVCEKTVRHFSGSEIMLIIGTLFIVLSGIAFGCAGWVNTSPSGRVMIMLMAVVMMSVAGEVFRRILKLDRTAVAFEIISTVLTAITVITAGFYELLGGWLAGEGVNMLFAVSSAVTGLVALVHWKLSGSKVFKYSACLSVSLTVIFLSSEVYGYLFAMIMLFMQILTTAIYVFAEINDDVIKKSVKISGIAFALCSLYYAVDKIFMPDCTAYTVMLAIWLELVFYGIYLKKSDLKALQSILSIFITFVFVDNMTAYDDRQIITASVIFTLIYMANRFIPCLNNKFSEVLTLGFAVYTSIASATLDNGYALIIPFIVSGLIMTYTFTGNKAVQTVAGLFSPVLPVIIAFSTYEYEWFVIVMSLVTFAVMKYTERKTDTVLYANIAVSGVTIFMWAMDSPELFLIPFACGVHIAVSCMLKNNFTGILSALALICTAEQFDMPEYVLLILFCCLMILSRIFYSDKILIRSTDGKKYDIIAFSVWIVFFMADSGFIRLMIIAVFTACLVRRKTNSLTGSILLSVSAFMTMLAVNQRPFLVPESEIIENKIFLGIIALMGLVYRSVWKNYPRVSRSMSDVIFILSFAGLIIDVMNFHRLGNTIFGLAVTAVILVISFTAKNRKWFGVSSVAVVTITVWASIRYLGKLDWWVYLFIAGVLFIAVASVSEYLKSRDRKILDFFSDWK
ncbi:MAG: hypothetical protein NC177_16950 [Ruminococcus flavefaciens]|nr:hypothetical protein [Ruminococcus flavefaciens]